MNFINRQNELKALESVWTQKGPNLFVVYGKRRVGKTELIKQFIKGKPAIYYLADKRTHKEQLAEVGRLFGEQFKDTLLAERGFENWLSVFRYIKEKVNVPFVFTIDEFPYLVEGDDAIPSIFQKGIDEYLKGVPVTVILSGSSIAMMEDQVLGHHSPLYGRRTGQALVQPMSFEHAWLFFPELDFPSMLRLYTVTGGMPAYLLQMDAAKELRTNIEEKVLDRNAFLHSEMEFLLREELREPRNYLSILRAISLGKTKFGEIVEATAIEKSSLTKYLTILEQLRLIEKPVPVTEKNPAKYKGGYYCLTDNFSRFWFKFIFPNKSNLEIGKFEEVNRKLDEDFESLVSKTYEETCQEILRKFEGDLFPFERVGRWWQSMGADQNEEIDVVAFNEESGDILFGEAKWSVNQVGTNIYEDLKRKAAVVDWHVGDRREHYVLFSKSGFTENMIKVAKEEGVLLIEGCEKV